ncbi:hypothetical protein ACTXT7_013694 [Hymenolepis weldensis]
MDLETSKDLSGSLNSKSSSCKISQKALLIRKIWKMCQFRLRLPSRHFILNNTAKKRISPPQNNSRRRFKGSRNDTIEVDDAEYWFSIENVSILTNFKSYELNWVKSPEGYHLATRIEEVQLASSRSPLV